MIRQTSGLCVAQFFLRRKGERFIYLPEAMVRHVIREDQITLNWLLGRAYRAGRSTAVLRADYAGARMCGVPCYLWRQLAIVAARYAVSIVCGQKERCLAGMALQKTSGAVVEYRRLASRE